MHILLSNDDGYAAPGLRILRSALLDAGHRVTTVAPDRNRSGASHSLTVLHSLRMQRHEDGVMSLDGTPTDCVMLALSAFMDERPDIVVSGINAGANMGDDTLYSGTVAAAMEGRSLGLPAIAVSSAAVSPKHYPTAARVVVDLLVRLAKAPLAPDCVFNVNVPDVPHQQLLSTEITRTGTRHINGRTPVQQDPRGRPVYWIGAAGEEADDAPGTDFHAVASGRVSITPLSFDRTAHDRLARLRDWVTA